MDRPLVLALVLILQASIIKADCECGFEEINDNCSLIAGINVSSLPGRSCNLPTERNCIVDESAGSAECICGCYWEGDDCEERIEVSGIYIVIALGIPLLFIFLSILLIIRREYKNNFTTWDIPAKHCVESPWSWCGPKIILVYRFCITSLAWGIFGEQMIRTDGSVLRAFTVWNWILLTSYFTIGFALSMKHLVSPSERNRLLIIERVFWAIMVIETVSTVLVMVVFWGLLYPTSPPDFQAFLRGFTSVNQHAINVLYMYLDFGMIYLPINFDQYLYIVIWASTYALFHSSILIYGLGLEDSYECPVYFFLDINDPLFTAWTFGLLIVYFLFFWIGFKASKIKMSFIEEPSAEIKGTEDEMDSKL